LVDVEILTNLGYIASSFLKKRGKKMEKLEELRKKLADRNLSKVAILAGIHPNSLYRLMKNDGYRPNMRTVEKLEEYLAGESEKS